jgi:hypothetical protein
MQIYHLKIIEDSLFDRYMITEYNNKLSDDIMHILNNACCYIIDDKYEIKTYFFTEKYISSISETTLLYKAFIKFKHDRRDMNIKNILN